MADKYRPTVSTALPGYSRGAAIGENLGTGLGQGLQFLLQDKMNRMMQAKQQKQTATGLESLLGVSPDQATVLSGIPEPLLKAIIPQMQKQQQTQKLMDQYQAGGVAGGGEQGDAGTEDSGSEFQRALAVTGGDVRAALKAESDAKKLAHKDKQLAFNINKAYMDKTSDRGRDARSDLQGLNTQMGLVNTGKLIGPRKKLFLDLIGDKLGLDDLGKSALMNTESQVFEKLSIPYFRDLKTKFGARPTQFEAKQLQKSFPTLYQTDPGKKIIINFMKHDSMSAVKENQIKNDIVKRNGGIPPLDLRQKTNSALDEWQSKEYLNLRNKISKTLGKESGPKMSAAEVGKGTVVRNKSNDLYFVSNGKNWELMMSDSEV